MARHLNELFKYSAVYMFHALALRNIFLTY